MANEVQKQRNEVAKQFQSAVTSGIESWFEAGRIVAEQIDKDPDFVDYLCEHSEFFTPELVMRFYAIGKRQAHPALFVSDSPGCRALLRLPYSFQEKHVTEPVTVLIHGDKGYETLKVDVRNLNPKQAKQVFSKDGIRSEAAQRAWIEEQKTVEVAAASMPDLGYRIVGRKIVVKRDVTLTARDLARILGEMES